MALKNLFDMVKADRYTADGREALIKAQDEETEDKVYQIGEISQKTGLQKTANGWVKPKKGNQPGAKKEEAKIKTNAMPKVNGPDMAVRNFESKGERVTNWNGTKNGFLISTTKGDYQYVEKADGSFELMDRPNVTQGEALQQSIKSHGEKAESKSGKQPKLTAEEKNTYKDIVREYMKNPSPETERIMNEAKNHLMKNRGASPAEIGEMGRSVFFEKSEGPESKGSDIPDFKGMESGDYDKKLRAEGWTTGGWEGNGTHASAIFKKGDRTIRVNEGQPGKITSVQEISKPAEKLPAKPTRGMSESYIRGTQLMKPAEDESQRGEQHWAGVLSGYDNTSVLEQRKQLQEKYDEFEEDIKDYDRRGLAPAVYAKRINQQNFIKGALKAIDDEMENRGMDPAPRTSVSDAAPRVLTGDTRIRVRKA